MQRPREGKANQDIFIEAAHNKIKDNFLNIFSYVEETLRITTET